MGQLHPVMVTILVGWPDLKLHKRLCLPVTSIKADAQGQEHSPPHFTAILGVKHYFPVVLTHASSRCFNLRFLITVSNFSSLADRRSFPSWDTQGFVVGFARGWGSCWDCRAVVCLCVWKFRFKMHLNMTVYSEVVIKQHKVFCFNAVIFFPFRNTHTCIFVYLLWWY